MTMTYGQIESALQAAIVASLPEDEDDADHYVYVSDFSDSYVIYCVGWSEYLQDDYTMDDDGNITLAGSPITVIPQTTYIPAQTNAAGGRREQRQVPSEIRAVMAGRGITELLGSRSPSPARVTSEALTYHRYSPHSYFRDRLLTDRVAGAAERLRQHAQEMDVLTKEREAQAWREFRASGLEYRVEPNRTDGQGGYFAPPGWLNELFATAKRPIAVLARLIPAKFALPQGISSVNLPIIASGTTDQQVDDLAAVPDSDLTDARGSSTVAAFAGQADIALQLLEQSPHGAMMDWVLYTDLTASYDADLENQLLYGLGTSAQQLPGVVSAASVVISYPDASPTGSEMWASLAQGAAQIGDLRKMPPEIWLMRTARWAWIQGSESTTGYPFGISPVFIGKDDETTPDPIGGIMGWPVFLDDAVSATLNSNQDQVICIRPSDLIFLESAPQTAIYLEPGSANLSARVQMHGYAAAITRYTSGIATVGGSGFVVQSGY